MVDVLLCWRVWCVLVRGRVAGSKQLQQMQERQASLSKNWAQGSGPRRANAPHCSGLCLPASLPSPVRTMRGRPNATSRACLQFWDGGRGRQTDERNDCFLFVGYLHKYAAYIPLWKHPIPAWAAVGLRNPLTHLTRLTPRLYKTHVILAFSLEVSLPTKSLSTLPAAPQR